MKKLFAVLKIESILFMRDLSGFFFTFIFPVIMLLLYGSIYGNEPTPYFNGLGAMDMSVPAYSVMIIGVTGLMSFPLTLAYYKENKIYKRFDASGAGKRIVLCAQLIVNFMMTLLGFVLLFLVGRLVYGIRITGSIPAVCLSLLLSMASVYAVGFFITAAAPNIKICNLLCYLCYFTMIFLSGSSIPKELFPDTLRRISGVMPLTYAVDALQASFYHTPDQTFWKSILVLLVILLVCGGLGAILYRRKSWV